MNEAKQHENNIVTRTRQTLEMPIIILLQVLHSNGLLDVLLLSSA